MRGGLDDALDKLARRDELRRRASGDAPGTPAAVTELVEAIAAVVGRHPGIGLTVGVDGVGEPLLLHFFYADGQVQVNAESPASAAPGSPGGPRHADVVVDVDEPVTPVYSAPPAAYPPDDQDRFGPAPFGYGQPEADRYYAESDTAERRYGSFDGPPPPPPHAEPNGYEGLGENSRDLGARMRDLGMASTQNPHPFAPTPPPEVPPQAQSPQRPAPSDAAQPTRRIQPEQYRAPAEASADERMPSQQPGMPAPLAQPIPLQVERPEQTEMAARRLAALLRDDPSLLSQQD
ncbi:MAG: hypothetical protein ABW046_00600 [Actinoplanes sp.]